MLVIALCSIGNAVTEGREYDAQIADNDNYIVTGDDGRTYELSKIHFEER